MHRSEIRFTIDKFLIFQGCPLFLQNNSRTFSVFQNSRTFQARIGTLYKMCKAPVKQSPPTNQHPTFLRAGCPSCHPTNRVIALQGGDSVFICIFLQNKKKMQIKVVVSNCVSESHNILDTMRVISLPALSELLHFQHHPLQLAPITCGMFSLSLSLSLSLQVNLS